MPTATFRGGRDIHEPRREGIRNWVRLRESEDNVGEVEWRGNLGIVEWCGDSRTTIHTIRLLPSTRIPFRVQLTSDIVRNHEEPALDRTV